MDRRAFLKALFVTGIVTAIDPTAAIEQVLTATNKLSDDSFITYVTVSMNLYVSNPRKCFVITGITE